MNLCPLGRSFIGKLVLLFLISTWTQSASAADQVVSDAGDTGGPNQLRAKLVALQSSGGGTLSFDLGTATIILANGILPDITANVTIDGGNVVTLSGGNTNPLFQIDAGGKLTLDNLTVTRGYNATGDGGAIRNGSGAGNGGTLNINNCHFLFNVAETAFSGGAIVSYGPLTITGSEFGSNSAGNGGALYPRFASAVTTISDCSFHDNATTNMTNGWGGAMLLWDGAPVTVSNSQFVTNFAEDGGAIYVFANSSLTMTGSDVSDNTADNDSDGTNYGGGIFNAGTLVLVQSTITENVVTDSPTTLFPESRGGGGVANLATGVMTVTGGKMSDNHGRFGGGILNFGKLTATNLTLAGNHSGVGGGVCNIRTGGNVGDMTMNGSTMSGNSVSFSEYPSVATPLGSAIFNSTTSTLSITNSTFSGNTGQGAIQEDNSSITLLNVTIANNSEGGLGSDQSPNTSVVVMTNTLLMDNGSHNCGSIGFNSFTHEFDLSSDATCGFGTGRDNVDLMLGPLADNGGPTQTLLPLAGSPAIDSGSGADAPLRDQRNYLRAGAAPDAGAAEFGGTIPVTLANISTRASVQTGANVLIGGFIVTGSGPKQVLLRGIGPSSGVAGALANPSLTLFDSAGAPLAANDNWQDAPNKQEIIDSGIPPSNNLESAILLTLDPAAYTVILSGAGGGTGIGLVEAYDLDRTAGSKLANISSRGFVQTGDNVMIGGFIVLGPDSQTVVVRAIGPSLPVDGALADPVLDLYDGQGVNFASNDNWRDTQEAEITATGLVPVNDLESATVTTLAPGGFTAIVHGHGAATGIALVEVYAVD